MVDLKLWPTLLDTDDVAKRKPNNMYRPPSAETMCYLDFSVSTTGMLAGVKVSSSSVLLIPGFLSDHSTSNQ